MLTRESYGVKSFNENALGDGASPTYDESLWCPFQLQETRNDDKFGERLQQETRSSVVNASDKKRAKNWE